MSIVNTESSGYARMKAIWQRCRDVYAGGDAVKARGTDYLPMLEGHRTSMADVGFKALQSASPYDGYRTRALFYPAGRRTVAGLTGLMFGHPITVAGLQKSDEPQVDDVTLTGSTLQAYAMSVCEDLLVVGRCGTLLDMPAEGGTRPYWVPYTAEQIVNVGVTRINGQERLSLLVLWEQVEEPDGADEFATVLVDQWRVLRLTSGVYSVEVYRRDSQDQTKFYVHTGETFPTRRGEPLDFIPFTFMSPSGIAPKIEHPPLLDLFDVNLSHYRTSADHEHGAHFTALPTPYVTGYKIPEGQTLGIGSGTAWVFESADAKAGMIEFSGAGLKSLADLKEEKRQLMATLGARLLETQKNTQEAAQTVKLRHAGESSALLVMGHALGQGLTQVLRRHLFWAGLDQDKADLAQVTVNPDVLDSLSPDDVRTLVSAWQAGAISKRTLYDNLAWGEWTRPGVTFEEEEAEIAREPSDDAALVP